MLFPKTTIKTSVLMMCMVGALSGCLDKASDKTDATTYTPEERPLGLVITSTQDAQYKPGETVTLNGRMVGTAKNGESVRWEQLDGPELPITSWTNPIITFKAPDNLGGSAQFKFRLSVIDPKGETVTDTSTGKPMVAEISFSIYDPTALMVFEAEDTDFAAITGDSKIVGPGDDQYITGASGEKATEDLRPGARVNYTLTTGDKTKANQEIKAGYYNLYVTYAIPVANYTDKEATVDVNGLKYEKLKFLHQGVWLEYALADQIQLKEGENKVIIGGGYDYYRIDNIKLLPVAAPSKPVKLPAAPVDALATTETKDLWTFLNSTYGSRTIAGQTEYMSYGSSYTGLKEFDKTVEITGGPAPAIVAYDYMDYSSSRVHCGAVAGTLTEDMIKAHKDKNVILSPMWHWNAPTKLKDASCNGTGATAWYNGFNAAATDFDLAAALANENGADYQALVSDIDDIALELKKLQDAGISVLWRPVHEAEGQWFWWGKSGPDAFKKLWKLMYTRMTDYHGLHNLIWVYTTAGSISADWTPDEQYFDVVGYDGYGDSGSVSSKDVFRLQFATLKKRFDGKKLIALTETGTVPDMTYMQEHNAWWDYFVTWNSSNGSNYGPAKADAATVKATYENAGTVTLKEVPGGRTPIKPGVYADFELDAAGWGAQADWSDIAGTGVSDTWSASGAYSVAITKNISALTSAKTNFSLVKFADIDVTGVKKISVTVNALNTGSATQARLFIKHGDSWTWVSSDYVTLSGAKTITLDISALGITTLKAIGVDYGSFDPSSTSASFFVDKVTFTDTSDKDTVKWDFEPTVEPFLAQINWVTTPGATASTKWHSTGARALAVTKDLSKEAGANSVILQAYPTDGISTTGKSKLKLVAYSANSGANTTGKLWLKDQDGGWHDAGAVNVTSGAIAMELDVSSYSRVTGLGVQFEGFDTASTAAEFYLDSVKLDNQMLYDFEDTGKWELQVNWGAASGLSTASDWSNTGNFALKAGVNLKTGDDNIVLQTYPLGEKNIPLIGVTKVKVVAHADNAGDAVTAQLFAKDQDQTWHSTSEIALVNGTANLELDISAFMELYGFGLRFQHPSNTTSESRFYIDTITFE